MSRWATVKDAALRAALRRQLEQHGSKRATARALGIGREHLQRLIRRHGLA